jgi:NAD(P)H-hydrate repair Nnr-like enzyme with NAD(P)H-hydrate dehydratase domain
LVCDTTSSALATAGTGDVLSGLMGSLIARQEPQVQHELADAAIGAVMIHSLAAELALDAGLNPTAVDIAYHVRSAMALLRESHE